MAVEEYGAVTKVEVDGARKFLHLLSSAPLEVSRYAPVGEGDELFGENGTVYIRARNGRAALFPAFDIAEDLKPGWPTIRFKEVETEEEEAGYRKLAAFHYRGSGLYGRRVPVIARVDDPFWPKVVGYIELTTDMMMNAPRNRLVGSGYDDPNGFGWPANDDSVEKLKDRVNLFVRVGRIVVVPEIRGAGLGYALYRYACRYANERFYVGGYVPYFILAIADSLKYIPTAEKAGFVFAGYTTGNADTIAEDIRKSFADIDMLRARDQQGELTNRGIIALQLRYAERIKEAADRLKLTPEGTAALLSKPAEELSDDEYAILYPILRFPKPVYFKGLNPHAEAYIERRVKELGLKAEDFDPRVLVTPLSSPFVLSGTSVTVISSIPSSKRVRSVEQGFGLHPENLADTVISDLSLEIPPRSTLLITGPSGSGKSLLLSLLTRSLATSSKVEVTGSVDIPEDAVFARLVPLEPDVPLVDQLVPEAPDIRPALFLLNTAALSEAHSYLKRFRDLSAGQQYRAMIAKMVGSGANVWVADEFCSAIDPITAPLVAANLRKVARRLGATVIVAAPHSSAFVRQLAPDIVVQFLPGRAHKVVSGAEFVSYLDGYKPPTNEEPPPEFSGLSIKSLGEEW